MKFVLCSLIVIVVMAVTTLDAACFQDKKMGYSIDFPRGWEVGPLSSFGINGTGAMSQNAVILVGVDKNYIKNFEPSDGFAKFYARTVMYNMYRAYCNKLGLVDAYSTTFKGYDAIYNMFKCNDEYVGTLYIIKNGYIYTMMSAFKDESSAKVIKASLATYKFTK